MKKERLVFEKSWVMMARQYVVAYFSDYTIESIVLTMIMTTIVTMILDNEREYGDDNSEVMIFQTARLGPYKQVAMQD